VTARLEDLSRGASIRGVVPAEVVTVVDVRWHGAAAVELTYKRSDGTVANRLLYREDEPDLEIAETGRPWSFDSDGRLFRLTAEAKRISLAYLFDPFLAVTTAMVEPLPHQITAVYESMLPRQPLRYLLADDPGAGKTIMTGLLIRELQVRGDLRRCLIVAPGSLVEQWQQELDEKFRLPFRIVTRDQIEASRSGNPFTDGDLLIARLDKLARDDDLQAKLSSTDWDLIVFDEAHKLSATLAFDEVKKTKRRQLGERARDLTRHFLLLTATPHNGKDADFQLFLSLLDPDRFEGHQRTAGEQPLATGDTTDLMRRLMKESLVRFDGTALFPPRHAHVVQFQLSPAEASLYERVTAYVRDEMNRAERLKQQGEGRRGSVVGFALTVLQRRLASSPEAIYQSLLRRRARLERKLAEVSAIRQGVEARLDDPELAGLATGPFDDLEVDEATAEEAEELEEKLVDLASAASSIDELQLEIGSLRQLEVQAAHVRELGTDRKWSELAGLMRDEPEMLDAAGSRRKLVIFTEHRDTLNYLARRLRDLLGSDEAVVEIHGGMHRELRRRNEASFKNDPGVHVLVATDAAGEGINLQRAHLMVNYDLPWNPNRLEQRFGRIHRIGQTETCHLWNLVATETREGDVYGTLLIKIEEETRALGGQVFDVLGRVEFGDRSLRELLVSAIREDGRPESRAKLKRIVDSALDRPRLQELLRERALGAESLDQAKVSGVREEMERAAAQRLQPHFVRSFFVEAFRRLGGDISARESERYEIRHVPAAIRTNARDRGLRLVLPRYERIAFEKDLVAVPGLPLAEFVAPGHPLLDATIDLILSKFGGLLRRGGRLIDRQDHGVEPRVLVFLEHSVTDQRPSVTDQRPTRDGRARRASERLEFVEMLGSGEIIPAGPAPFLDYEPLRPDEEQIVETELSRMSWVHASEIESRAVTFAIEHMSRAHLDEVRARIDERVARTAAAVKDRLGHEVAYWSHRADELERRELAGQTPKINSRRASGRAAELSERLQRRLLELEQERQLTSLPPVVVGGGVIIPQGLIDRLDGVVSKSDGTEEFRRAVDVAMTEQSAVGREPHDVTASRMGYDILSRHEDGSLRFVKVALTQRDGTISLPRNAVLACLNARDSYWIAAVGSAGSKPRWLQPTLDPDVDFGQASVVLRLD
jgi:superfamily II DNA or RNA helicase